MKEEFEWNENKRLTNLEKHKLAFEDAVKIFNNTQVEHVPSDYRGEKRWVTIGELDGRAIMVVWTHRGLKKRIITARKLGKNDQGKYQTYDPGGSTPDQG